MSRIGRLLSFSNIIACLALFIALGGSVYAAGKISGSQIKAGSLPGNRIKAKTVTAKQVKPGTLTGTQIQAGTIGAAQIQANSLTSAQINQSTLTGVSAANLGSVQYAVATASISPTAENGTQATAGCPAGTSVIGGGATVSNEEQAFINDSGPNSTRNGWTATGFSFGSPGNSMTVTAICTAVKTTNG
jgi:hypothetical protein